MMTLLRLASLFFLITGQATAQNYAFCTDGIAEADFDENQPIDVIVAQAPLFSTNPKIGGLFGLIGTYHSSLVFAQGSGIYGRYWTLEFDNTAPSFLQGINPDVTVNESANGAVTFDWHNDARYCLSKGLKWGREHWTKTFDVVTSISVDQAKRAFTDFLPSVNVTKHGAKPQYQLWRVASTDFFGRMKKTLIPDTTCNEGVIWFLHYLKTEIRAPIPDDFKFKATTVLLKAQSVEIVNPEDPGELAQLILYFKTLKDFTSGHKSTLGRLLALIKLLYRSKYVYDNNAGVFYRLVGGSWFPWPHYVELPLVAPPFAGSAPAKPQGVVV